MQSVGDIIPTNCERESLTQNQVEVVQFTRKCYNNKVYEVNEDEKKTADTAAAIEEEEELEFLSNVLKAESRYPLIIKGCNVGSCVSKWTVEYLKSVNPNKLVKVHQSVSPQLDFRNKNFKYESITFDKLIDYCSSSCQDPVVSEASRASNKAAVNEDDSCHQPSYYYLRSLGEDPRGKDISDLSIHFPELYKDIRIPQLFPQSSFFSSVFRITSPDLQLWTHYDTCDNILIQIIGRKRIVFFPPEEALNLYLDGDKSQVIDIDQPDLELYPNFAKIKRLEGILEEGDIVYIPSLWFHNVTALSFSISVNVFWRNLDCHLYDKKDTYGNRDIIPAQLCFRTLDKAASQLKVLPSEYQDFYLRRMIISLQNRIESIQSKKD